MPAVVVHLLEEVDVDDDQAELAREPLGSGKLVVCTPTANRVLSTSSQAVQVQDMDKPKGQRAEHEPTVTDVVLGPMGLQLELALGHPQESGAAEAEAEAEAGDAGEVEVREAPFGQQG